MTGSFSEESLIKFNQLASEIMQSNFNETKGSYDFTRCVRPNGTFYGTSGNCRKGTEVPLHDLKNPLGRGYTPLEKAENALRIMEKSINNPEYTPTDKEIERYGRLKNAISEMRIRAPKRSKVRNVVASAPAKSERKMKESFDKARSIVERKKDSSKDERDKAIETFRVAIEDAKDQLQQRQRGRNVLARLFTGDLLEQAQDRNNLRMWDTITKYQGDLERLIKLSRGRGE